MISCEIQGLNFSYPQSVNCFANFNWSFQLESCLLFNGWSGVGKSTLLQILSGLLGTAEQKKAVSWNGRRLAEMSELEIRERFLYMHQSIDNQFLSLRVEDEILNCLIGDTAKRERLMENCESILDTFSLKELRYRTIASLSGGQKQRLLIAVIFSSKHEVIILDEALAQLDSENIIIVQNLLKKALDKKEKYFIISDHRSEFFEMLAESKWTMTQNQMIDYRRYPEAFLSMTGIRDPEKKCILSLTDIQIEVNHTSILRGINLDIYFGDRIALMGLNGSGKSTLLQLIAGLFKRYKGRIKTNIETKILFQNPDLMLIENSVEDEISDTVVLKELSLEKVHANHPLNLSKGQRLRCAFGSILESSNSLLVLDELSSGQDTANINSIIKTLIDREQKQFLFSTHDFKLAEAIANRLIIMKSGGIVYDGNVSISAYQQFILDSEKSITNE